MSGDDQSLSLGKEVAQSAVKSKNSHLYCHRTAKKKHDDETTAAVVTGRCVHVSQRYEKLGRLGEGTYGVVYKARDRITGQFVALKRCIPHNESSDGFPITTLREIQALKLCRCHPNVVHLEQVAVGKTGVFLVFEHCQHDLAHLIDAQYAQHHASPFSLANTKTLLRQMLSALEFLHAHCLMHRDLKLSNCLYTEQGMLKLADFGLSRSYSVGSRGRGSAAAAAPPLTPNVASLWYRPPELLLGATTYNESIDLWGAGCIFAELLKGYPLFNGKTELEQLDKIFSGLGVPLARDWPAFSELPLVRDGSIQALPSSSSTRSMRLWVLDEFAFLGSSGLRLLTSLLGYDPDQRWSAEQALTSSFFAEEPFATPTDRMPHFTRTYS